ncbi:MAG: Protease 3 precursor [Candidatus Omnitrophica bacterium ADurb.Bin277]|nr:MAG: Protease 3 precursor [Candidatus Omnitrophica bacterium ADurb.Bin277]
MPYNVTTLIDGLRVLTVPMPGRDSAAVAVWVKTGGRYETKKNSGVSHFLEHMLFKGTKRRTTRQIKEEIEGVGGILNAFTGEEVTCYFSKLLKEYYPQALDVLSDMVLNATIPADEFCREKPVILEEIKMYRDLPSHHVHDLMAELLWPEQPLGWPLAGSPESVAGLSRSDLAVYMKQHYQNANILIAVSGNIPHSEVVERVHSIYRGRAAQKSSVFQKAVSRQSKPRTNFYEKKTEQTHLVIGFHALPRMHADRYKLGLLHIILGANMSSRLFDKIREKRGLAYEIKSGILTYADTGAFTVSAGVETVQTAKAVEVIMGELTRITRQPVKPGELRRAKDYFMSQVYLGVEDTLDHLLWAGERLLCGNELPNKEDIRRKVEEISWEELRELAAKIFRTPNLNLALIGPVGDKMQKEIRKRLVIG